MATKPSVENVPSSHPQSLAYRNLPLGAPDVLEEAVALGQAVEGVVALTHGADKAGQRVDDVLTLDGATVLVDLRYGNLARSVVLRADDATRRRALARDVPGRGGGLELAKDLGMLRAANEGLCIDRWIGLAYRSTISPRSFSILAYCRKNC